MKSSLIAGILLLGSISSPSLAQTDMLGRAQDVWKALSGSTAANKESARSPLTNDTWGEPGASAGVARDERFIDERMGPVVRGHVPEERMPEVKAEQTRKAKAAKIAPVEKAPAMRLSPLLREVEPADKGSCANVARTWEGASNLANRGEYGRAYSAYLGLLASCSKKTDLEGTLYQAFKTLPLDQAGALLEEPIMESSALADARVYAHAQMMFAYQRNKQPGKALHYARAIRSAILASGDAGALVVSGWLEHEAGEAKQAEGLFKAALKADAQNVSARQGLIVTLLRLGSADAASREIERLPAGDRGDLAVAVLQAQARAALGKKAFDRALALLDKAQEAGASDEEADLSVRAWAYQGAGRAQEARGAFERLLELDPENEDYRKGQVQAIGVVKDVDALARLAGSADAVGDQAREQLALLMEGQGRRAAAGALRGKSVEGLAGEVSTNVAVRSKGGDAGEAKLNHVEAPVVSGSLRMSSSLTLRGSISTHTLDDGLARADGRESRIGIVHEGEQTRTSVDAGTSQVAGQTRPVFNAKLRYWTGNGFIEAGVEREPVMDSLRSYAGTRLPDGRLVGRAMRTGATGSGAMPVNEDLTLQWTAGAGTVSSESASTNAYLKGRVTLLKEFASPRFSWLAAGPEARYETWSRDENEFEEGGAGYFSPSSDVGLGLRGHLQTLEGGRSLHKASAYTGFTSRGMGPGADSGLVIESDAASAYLLSSNLIVSGSAMLRSSPGYSEFGLNLGLTIPFERRTGLYASDLPKSVMRF